MLVRYQNKQVRITTEDGAVFTGIAEVLPSGWGLHAFDREEESIRMDDVILFKSDIQMIEELSETSTETADPLRSDEMIGALLQDPYWIVDILPEQVPADAAGQLCRGTLLPAAGADLPPAPQIRRASAAAELLC